jgi:hypothetical protein
MFSSEMPYPSEIRDSGDNAMKTKSMTPAALASNMQSARFALSLCLSALILALGAVHASAATVTNIVGTCKKGKQFSTIQAALDASPSPDIVEVCPGWYPEQITITKPVTLEGIAVGNQDQVQIATPASGLSVNANVYTGDNVPDPAAAHIYVNNVTGAVNLTNLVVNDIANGQSGSGAFDIGILYQNTTGTINHVVTFDQNGENTIGWGIFLQGGSSNPMVTVENCSLHDFSQGGLWAIGTTDKPNLTISVKSNVVASSSTSTYNVVAEEGTNATVASNFVSGGLYGIYVLAPEGSITSNTIYGSQYGIGLVVDGTLVKSNILYDTVLAGIDIAAENLKTSMVESNTIKTVTNPNQGGGTGIELNCHNISSTQVHTNTFLDSLVAYGDALPAFAGSDTYFNVANKIVTTSCN